MNLTFDHLERASLAWIVVALLIVGLWAIARRRAALRRLIDARLAPRLTPGVSIGRGVVRVLLATAGLMLLVAAATEPRWGTTEREVVRRDVDVIVLLDVSRSMLAQDLAPNRLERAKLAIADDLLPALGGDRIGLITFAGAATLACPLTNDYGFFRLALDDVSSLSSPRGGTLIGDALRAAGKHLQTPLETHRLIILITDGEDQDSFPVQAAQGLWADERIPVLAIGLGDPIDGARIPVRSARGVEYLEYDGETVFSKGEFDQLRQIARISDLHAVLAAGTRNFDLGALYQRVVSALEAETTSDAASVRQPSQYYPFALAAFVLLLLDSLIGEGRRFPVAAPRGLASGLAVALAVWLMFAPPPSHAQQTESGRVAPEPLPVDDPRAALQRGNALYAAGDYAAAGAAYDAALQALDPRRAHGETIKPELLFNRGAAAFQRGEIETAREAWLQAAPMRDAAFESEVRYNLARAAHAQALSAVSPPDPASGGAPNEPRADPLQSIESAIRQYREAITLDPALQPARRNLELALKLRDRLRQQQDEQQEQDQQQQGDEGEQGEQQDDASEENPSTQPSDEQQPGDNQQQSDDSSSSDPNAHEPNQSDPTQTPSDPNQQQPSSDPNAAAQEDPNASQAESDPNDQPTDPNTADPNSGQARAANPTAAQSGEGLTPLEVQGLLQQVRDRDRVRREELRRRAMLQALREAQNRPVERDW